MISQNCVDDHQMGLMLSTFQRCTSRVYYTIALVAKAGCERRQPNTFRA